MHHLLETAFTRHQGGDLAEATRLYREILALDPLQADALHMLGVIARQKGNNELALKLIETALGQRTEMPLAWHNRAILLRLMNRNDEALQSAEQAVNLNPDFAESWDMIGFLRRDKRDFDGAREAHARAVTLRPDDLHVLSNYALLLYTTGDLRQAYQLMQKVEERDPNLAPQTMGNILKAAGYPDRALPYYRRSYELLPDNDELRVTRAMAHLQIGDFAEGWKIWETRRSLDHRFQHVPFWQGQRVDHLLVHEDQGLGDAFQCARYIPELRRYAKNITVQVTRVLHTIFAASFPDCDVLTLDDAVPAVDGRIRMLSLPAFFGANENNIPTSVPYLRAGDGVMASTAHGARAVDTPSPSTDASPLSRLAALPKPRIGIVWGGNPHHLNDRLRSIPFDQIAPLLNIGGAHIAALQKGAQKNGTDLAALGIFDADPYLNDFSDTAGLLTGLDLLITVDTSVAHLAGALCKPVWLLLPFDPDWRWLLGREDSPWYPSMRLFRQSQPGDWAGVIERVGADLRRFISGDNSVLQPATWNGGCLQQNPHAIRLLE